MSRLMEVYDDEIELVKQEAYEQGKADGIREANINHNIECGDCVRQITAADEERIRADGIRKFEEYLRIKCHVDVSECLEWYEKEQKGGEQT